MNEIFFCERVSFRKKNERWINEMKKLLFFFKTNKKTNDLKSFEQSWNNYRFYWTNEFFKWFEKRTSAN